MPAIVNCTVVGSCPVSPLLLIALPATTCSQIAYTMPRTRCMQTQYEAHLADIIIGMTTGNRWASCSRRLCAP